jgi:hypothetical protein
MLSPLAVATGLPISSSSFSCHSATETDFNRGFSKPASCECHCFCTCALMRPSSGATEWTQKVPGIIITLLAARLSIFQPNAPYRHSLRTEGTASENGEGARDGSRSRQAYR